MVSGNRWQWTCRKLYYYRGLKECNQEKGYLTDTCLAAQDKYKAYLDFFRIKYE